MQNIDETEFYYPHPSLSATGKQGSACKIILKGLRYDHIFETVRASGCFYENPLLEMIGLLAGKKVGVVVDVGANIGNHTLYFSKVMGSKVICVEANPKAIELLRANVSLNGVADQTTIVEVAASNQSGFVMLVNESATNSNLGATRVTECSPGETKNKVPSQTLDEIILSVRGSAAEEISLIKIDVEGAEERVLIGALKTIEQYKPMIVAEAATIENRQSIDLILRKHGYHRYGPMCATPTYIFCQSRLSLWKAALTLRFRRVLRRWNRLF